MRKIHTCNRSFPGGSHQLAAPIQVHPRPRDMSCFVGEYLFTIYQGDQPDPIGAGVFTFISSEQSPTMG